MTPYTTNRPMDKRTKALVHLENALRELSLALSTLGGKTRNKPKVFPPPYRFIARQYIESLILRLRVTQLILAKRDWFPSEAQASLMIEYDRDRVEHY